MSHIQVRCLLGPGGQTIQSLMRETGAQIVVNAPPQASEGDVVIQGGVPGLGLAKIKEVLVLKGCPLIDPTSSPDVALAALIGNPGIVEVPMNLVGQIIGRRDGALLPEIHAKLGVGVIIQKLPYPTTTGGQIIQIAGDRWVEAKEMVVSWLRQRAPGKFTLSPVVIAAPARVALG